MTPCRSGLELLPSFPSNQVDHCGHDSQDHYDQDAVVETALLGEVIEVRVSRSVHGLIFLRLSTDPNLWPLSFLALALVSGVTFLFEGVSFEVYLRALIPSLLNISPERRRTELVDLPVLLFGVEGPPVTSNSPEYSFDGLCWTAGCLAMASSFRLDSLSSMLNIGIL